MEGAGGGQGGMRGRGRILKQLQLFFFFFFFFFFRTCSCADGVEGNVQKIYVSMLKFSALVTEKDCFCSISFDPWI